MPRLFVAAWPTDAVRAALRTLPAHREPGVRPVPEANWHVTLRFVGDADPEVLAETLAGADLPRVVARLGPAIERLDARQIVVPVDGVDPLAAAVRVATQSVGDVDPRRFRGHLTVARTKPAAQSALLDLPFDASFAVDEVAVVASDLLSTGAVYTTLAAFPTTDR